MKISSLVAGKYTDMEKTSKEVRYSEAYFTKRVIELCRQAKHEQAALFYLENVSKLMETNLNYKDKLNILMFLPRFIQLGGATKHGYNKLLAKVKQLETALEGCVIPEGNFIDLGCGAHDPLGLATYFYLNGFCQCYGVDLLEPRVPEFSSISMYDILANARNFPARYCFRHTKPGDIVKRIASFKLGLFEKGQYKEALQQLKGQVEARNEDICSADLPLGSFSLIVSFAVLEHVSNIDGVAQRLFELLCPGGYLFHFVDLQDHRCYSKASQFHPLSFLTEETAPANMNRLRAPQILSAHEKAGFEIISEKRTNIDVGELRSSIIQRFQYFTDDELGAIKQTLLVRKPPTEASSE